MREKYDRKMCDLDLAMALSLSLCDAVSSAGFAAQCHGDAKLAQELQDEENKRLGRGWAYNPFISLDDECLDCLGRLEGLGREIAAVAPDSNVHAISHPCGQVFQLVHGMLSGQRGFSEEELHLVAVDMLEKMARDGEVSGMLKLASAVRAKEVVKESEYVMGRLDLLLGLLGKLNGSSADVVQSMRHVLADNKRLGGGCQQGMFNRFCYILLMPKTLDLLRDACELSLDSKLGCHK